MDHLIDSKDRMHSAFNPLFNLLFFNWLYFLFRTSILFPNLEHEHIYVAFPQISIFFNWVIIQIMLNEFGLIGQAGVESVVKKLYMLHLGKFFPIYDLFSGS